MISRTFKYQWIRHLHALLFCLLSTSVAADWMPFTVEDGSIILDIEIAGKPARALLDTGANLNAVSVDFVDQYGQDFVLSSKNKTRGDDKVGNARRYSAIPINFFGSNLTLTDVAALDLGKNIDLLMGGEMFRNVILQIDYPGSRLQILSKDAVNLRKDSNVRLKRASGSLLPAVEVEVNGTKAWLLLDAGFNSGIYLQRDFAIENDLLATAISIDSTLNSDISESASTDGSSLNTVKIGPYDLVKEKIHVPAEGQSVQRRVFHDSTAGIRSKRGVETTGLLGYNILKNFVVTIDYGDRIANLYLP